MLGDGNRGEGEEEEVDERTRRQYLSILQYLTAHNLLETLSAMESETGVSYDDGALPVASVLEASLDMFSSYSACSSAASSEEALARAAEEELLKIESGACCTGPCSAGVGQEVPGAANVTAVAWAAVRFDEYVAMVASTDRRIRLVDAAGQTLVEAAGLASPILGLDVASFAQGARCQEVLATSMGGEVILFNLRGPQSADSGAEWALDSRQQFKDHTKHVTSGRFAPLGEDGPSQHFVTVSRDHKAMVYGRNSGGGYPSTTADVFSLVGNVSLAGEVTACCWASPSTFVLAAREDHQLHYWDVNSSAIDSAGRKPKERLKVNLNSLGDSIVSFTVLALAVSADRELIAACTDKSRVIVLKTFTNRQLRNLYGAVVDVYDVPSLCFSLDRSFIYVTSTLPAATRKTGDDEELVVADVPGQVVVFDVCTGEPVIKLPCHEKAVRCMHRHPLSEALVTGSFDKTVKFWG